MKGDNADTISHIFQSFRMNKMKTIFGAVIISVLVLSSCGGNTKINREVRIPSFPYQAYLDSLEAQEDEVFPTIGDDGNGFNAISHKIRYPEMPDTLSLSHFADSLLQCYNIAIAFNTMAYDIGTAERYMTEPDFGLEQADALDSINLSGISIQEIRDPLRRASQNAASYIRRGIESNSETNDAVDEFYSAYNSYIDDFFSAHIDDKEFAPATVLPDYDEIHAKALSDTISFRRELLNRVLEETDFARQCVLAREFAYANYHSPQRDDKELVAVIDKLLRTNKHSPLLGELWRIWRLSLQINILGSRSNDGAMYNLFYNDMRNRIALVYIGHLKTHPRDNIAFKEFVRLAQTYNIVRNSPCMIGNNANLEDMELLYSVFNSSEDESE